jgi:hypothetical protein
MLGLERERRDGRELFGRRPLVRWGVGLGRRRVIGPTLRCPGQPLLVLGCDRGGLLLGLGVRVRIGLGVDVWLAVGIGLVLVDLVGKVGILRPVILKVREDVLGGVGRRRLDAAGAGGALAFALLTVALALLCGPLPPLP